MNGTDASVCFRQLGGAISWFPNVGRELAVQTFCANDFNIIIIYYSFLLVFPFIPYLFPLFLPSQSRKHHGLTFIECEIQYSGILGIAMINQHPVIVAD